MIDLGTLYAQFKVDTKDGIAALKGAANETSNVETKTSSLVSTVKKALAGLGIGIALKKIADGLKMIVSKYADFEQLIGGVETLFKDSADKVSQYADEAYKTAGLSANQYMETVTGFSASLLQSLDGDTNKAADAANQAIIDMSDNANKMGTSMESIQNAYQGFAKQNYTMLDNLKLGYGGTKEEMERLLKDAEKLTGVKYDISNLNDVYSAIHAVQTELGITGTTALEAETTISGSINSLKASWENLLIGFGRDDANISQLVANVVNNAVTVVKNIIPVLGQVFVGIKEAVSTVIETIVTNITENFPEFITKGGELLTNLASGFYENLPVFLEKLPEIITGVVNFITENLPLIVEQGINIVKALVKGLIDNMPEIISAIGKIMAALCNAIDALMGSIIESGIMIIKAIIEGILSMANDAKNNIKEFVQKNIIKPITDKVSDFKAAGKRIFTAVFDGIKDVWNSIKAWVDEKISWLTDKLAFWRNGKSEMDGSHRTGLSEVPFDGYRAVLHKGEMVLTQPEADRYRNGEDRAVQTQPTTVETNVTVEFTGNLSALGRILQPVIKKEEMRRGTALIGGAY